MRQTSNWDIVVVGGAYTDYVVRGTRLPVPGETVVGQEWLAVPGGKGANQAVEAARLGARVAMVACVGTDARADQIITGFRGEGVDTRYVVRDPTVSTGMSLIQVNEQGHKQMMVALGANQRLREADIEQATQAISSAKVLLTQLEIPLDVARRAMHIGREAGVRIIFDPAPSAPLPADLFGLVDVIKPDAKEAQAMTGIEVQDRDTARQAAEQLLRRGVKVVAIQAGSQGDLLIWQEGECWLPRIPVKRVDATGAGDAFAAALAVALAEGRRLQEAGPFASAAAALTTTKLGARPALPLRQAVESLLSTQQ